MGAYLRYLISVGISQHNPTGSKVWRIPFFSSWFREIQPAIFVLFFVSPSAASIHWRSRHLGWALSSTLTERFLRFIRLASLRTELRHWQLARRWQRCPMSMFASTVWDGALCHGVRAPLPQCLLECVFINFDQCILRTSSRRGHGIMVSQLHLAVNGCGTSLLVSMSLILFAAILRNGLVGVASKCYAQHDR